MTTTPLFKSPSKGLLDFEGMFQDILAFVRENSDTPYNLIVGTDSQKKTINGIPQVTFVTAVVLHRIGKGAKYYYQTQYERPMASVKQRMVYEASLSLGLASRMTERLSKLGVGLDHIEIHIDVGYNGKSSEAIKEVVGMVTGSGFEAKIKPDSFVASSVADKHTK